MKFGEYLRKQQDAEWKSNYINYDHLKFLIKELEPMEGKGPAVEENKRETSLSVSRPTDQSGMPINTPAVTAEMFYVFIEDEMRKIDQFTKDKLQEIRAVLADVETELNAGGAGGRPSVSCADMTRIKARVDAKANDFLRLEKYVNLNFTGFHKILKKHDKRLPSTPCKPFYISRLHQQSWIQTDQSSIIVAMSRLYSTLRGDEEAVQEENAKQVRDLCFFPTLVRTYPSYALSRHNLVAMTTDFYEVKLDLRRAAMCDEDIRESTLVQELSTGQTPTPPKHLTDDAIIISTLIPSKRAHTHDTPIILFLFLFPRH